MWSIRRVVSARRPLLWHASLTSKPIRDPFHVRLLIKREGAQGLARFTSLIENRLVIFKPLSSVGESPDYDTDFLTGPCRLGTAVIVADELAHDVGFVLLAGLAVLSLLVESNRVDLVMDGVDDALMQPREHEG